MSATASENVTIDQAFEDAVAAYRAGRLAEAEAASLQVLGAIAGQLGAPRRGIELLEKVVALQPRLADGQIQLAKRPNS